MSKVLNRIRQQISSPTGTGGPLILASVAYSNAYLTIAGAGGEDAAEYCYIIEEGQDWEIQRGVWTSGANSLARNTPIMSSIAGVAGTTKMSLAGAATVRIIMDADEISLFRNVRAVTAASDTMIDGHKGSMTIYNRATAIAVALAAPSGNSFRNGWKTHVKNIGAGAATITATGATITSDGGSSSTLTLQQYESALIFSDGTNYVAIIQKNFWANALSLTSSQQSQARGNIGAIGYGFVNRFRNGTMDIWQRGTGNQTVTTSGAYTADGWIVTPTGASVTTSQAGGRFATAASLKITGATSVTGATVKQRIESAVAAQLTSQTVTVQAQIYNATGGAITPTLTVKHPTALDTWAATATDVNAVSLQSCPDGVWTQVAYTFTASGSSNLGLEVTFDFGNNLSTTGKSVQITEVDIRATPGVATGLNSSPPQPELRPASTEMVFCQRYFQRFENRSGGTYYPLGIAFYPTTVACYAMVQFMTPMRVAPVMSTDNIANWLLGGTSNIVPTAVSYNHVNTQSAFTTLTVSGATAGQAAFALIAAGSYLQASSEL